MSKAVKWIIVLQLVGVAFLTPSTQLPNCPLRPSPGSTVLDQMSLSSQNGALALALTLRNAADSFGYMHYCFDYSATNGDVEAPTLRLNPGDNLTIDSTNQLTVAAPASA